MASILVVDDEIGIRELLSEILGDEGHVVSTAENAECARKLRAEMTPDLVLLDIWMPDTDGVTLLKEWQRDGLLTMPVIMMSGHATIDTAVEATRIGALNFLEKPITLQKLLKAVQQGLIRRQENARLGALNKNDHLPASLTTGYDNLLSPENRTNPGEDTKLPPAATPTAPVFTFSFELPLREAREEFERAYFEHHLNCEGGSMTRVAEKTGLERTHLYRKLKQLSIEPGRTSKKHNL